MSGTMVKGSPRWGEKATGIGRFLPISCPPKYVYLCVCVFFFSFCFFLQVKTELMTPGGAQHRRRLCSQTEIRFQPRAAQPHHLGKEAEKSHERFFSKPGNKAAVIISTEGDPSSKKKKIFFNNKNHIKFSNSLFLK